jgi:hypothetical protein
MTDTFLCTQAWRLRFARRSIPGVLKLAKGRLSLTTDEKKHDFNVALSEVTRISFPWYYCGGGIKIKIGGETYKLSFVQPEGAEDIPFELLPDDDSSVSISAGVIEGCRTGSAWKEILRA